MITSHYKHSHPLLFNRSSFYLKVKVFNWLFAALQLCMFPIIRFLDISFLSTLHFFLEIKQKNIINEISSLTNDVYKQVHFPCFFFFFRIEHRTDTKLSVYLSNMLICFSFSRNESIISIVSSFDVQCVHSQIEHFLNLVVHFLKIKYHYGEKNREYGHFYHTQPWIIHGSSRHSATDFSRVNTTCTRK